MLQLDELQLSVKSLRGFGKRDFSKVGAPSGKFLNFNVLTPMVISLNLLISISTGMELNSVLKFYF